MPLAYAGLRKRAGAFFWDALILALPTAAVAWAAPLCAAIPAVLYYIALEAAPRQAGVGKRRLGLRVIEVNGRPVGPGRAAARAVLKILPWAAMAARSPWVLGVAAVLFALILLALVHGPSYRTWYDRLSGTSVICIPAAPLSP